ncbi:hypothetical protein CDAR_596801 [Caerostris darwini]|uniref:Uncharacterized protein n=1 Tax=Caerostris darwini TaxID=1538125 RepID=A0AAV4WFW7_9ARAC|nr:hypothetical protein CDAR_596801 [Caerostris darwini]
MHNAKNEFCLIRTVCNVSMNFGYNLFNTTSKNLYALFHGVSGPKEKNFPSKVFYFLVSKYQKGCLPIPNMTRNSPVGSPTGVSAIRKFEQILTRFESISECRSRSTIP